MYGATGERIATETARGRVSRSRFPRKGTSPLGVRAVAAVAGWRGLPPQALLQNRRGTKRLALARQEAMYLMHVALSCSYAEVADHFGRDRTTVAHACSQVEDLRDAADYDLALDRLEAQLVAARRAGEAEDGAGR